MRLTRAHLGVVALVALLASSACSAAATTAPAAPTTAAAPSVAPSAAAASMAASAAPAASAAAAPTVPSGSVSIQGAGSTFAAPLYEAWFQAFDQKYPNVKLDYQANGSGAGITAITQQTVDFGATDAAMKDSEIAALPAGTHILHVPTALGAVVVIYNLPGVQKLQLDASNVAGLFLGTIKTWNDPAIAANNPGVTLPSTSVLVVHRSDGSGTTNAFTSYLDAVSPVWHTKVGVGKSVSWPTGIGASGNQGVATGVKQTPGAVGYVELQYATTANLNSAYLKNADGNWVQGSTAGVTDAAASVVASFPADFRQAPIINAAGAQTYPIASYTYVLIYVDQKDATKGQALVAWLQWALTDGQAMEASLGYAPLPQAVQQKALAELHQVTSGGSPIWPS